MTRTNFTFSTLAEAEEAWETMRQMMWLGDKLEMPRPGWDEVISFMDKAGKNIRENSGR